MHRLAAVLLVCATAASAAAQGVDPPIVGPPPPAAPAVIARDASGITLRATRVDNFNFDGRLDDPVYERVPPFGDFIQQEPHEGQPAQARTDVWVLYDADNLYVAARLWEDEPDKRIATEMRRDANNLYNNDHFGVSFDTFYDRRNGYGFAVNYLGGELDWSINNEQPNNSWNGLWDVRTADFGQGWTVEIRFPFRSFRHREGGHVWGMNFRRMVRATNELSYLAPVLASWGRPAMSKMSVAATVVGIDSGTEPHNIDAKFYGLGSVLTDRNARPPYFNDPDWNGGGDVKWGIRQTLIADFTVNTDFAQVEDDEQQVNLTRFSLFFPEKRDFFLEGADTFAFGGGGGGGGGGGSTPLLFYSRQIGLANGVPVPIRAGTRLLGRSGSWNFGALEIETGESTDANTPATNFAVGRVSYDFLARSRVGGMVTMRNPVAATRIGGTGDAGLGYGVDAAINPTREVSISGYLAGTDTPAVTTGNATPSVKDGNLSYRGSVSWNADRYGLSGSHLTVQQNFRPEVGLVRRSAFRQSSGSARFSPRPGWRGVRKISFESGVNYLTDLDNAPESKSVDASVGLDLDNSDAWSIRAEHDYERLDGPFNLGGGVAVPVGQYTFNQMRTSYSFGQQRPISGSLSFTRGGYYNGTLTALGWSGRVEFSSQVYAEPSVSWNWVRLPAGPADTNLASTRITYTITPHMFTSALIQYQSRSHSLTTNARLRWEYRPGSELFVVYSDGRTTLERGFPDVENRSFVVKVTRLLRW